MSAASSTSSTGAEARGQGAGRAFSTQVYYLAQRSVLRTLRQPATVLPAIAFPMLLLAVYASGLGPASSLEGFPADSYLNFIFVFPLIQGAVFAAISAGTDLARHARVLHRAHDAAMAGGSPPTADLLRRVLRRSRARARACGVDPDPCPGAAQAGPEEIEARRAASPCIDVVPELRASLNSVAESADHIHRVTTGARP